MKTRWYFIIAGAAVLGFAAWYQDFHRRDSRRREDQAAAQTRQHTAEAERRHIEQVEALERARQDAEARRGERADRAQREALAQARREEWQSHLTAVRDETGALRVTRDRITREIAEVEQRIATQQNERAAIARENEFLQRYITEAAASVARIGAVAEKAEKFLASAAAAPEPTRRLR